MIYIAKLTWTDGQCRLTIPKLLVKEVNLTDFKFVVLEKTEEHQINIRRVVDEKTFKAESSRHPA